MSLAASVGPRPSHARIRVAVARAGDGPAPTLVVDLTSLGRALEGEGLLAALHDARRAAMERVPAIGAKTIGLIAAEGQTVELMFLQGLPDGSVDTSIRVCANSAACALTVARDLWQLLPAGPLTVRMGERTFFFEETQP